MAYRTLVSRPGLLRRPRSWRALSSALAPTLAGAGLAAATLAISGTAATSPGGPTVPGRTSTGHSDTGNSPALGQPEPGYSQAASSVLILARTAATSASLDCRQN